MRPVTVMRGLLEVPRAPGLNPRVTGLSCDEAQRDAPRHLIRDRGGIYVSCDVKSTRPDPEQRSEARFNPIRSALRSAR
jgi:hypothetical protein